MSTCLTVENAQSHVTAFQPISEAARSWSDDKWSYMFTINFGVRQGSVLSPVLFAIYINDVCTCSKFHRHSYVILYADDILLLAPSVTILDTSCELELTYLDMAVNSKKSCCLRVEPRCDKHGWLLDILAYRLYFGVYCTMFFCFFLSITRWWIKLLIKSSVRIFSLCIVSQCTWRVTTVIIANFSESVDSTVV